MIFCEFLTKGNVCPSIRIETMHGAGLTRKVAKVILFG